MPPLAALPSTRAARVLLSSLNELITNPYIYIYITYLPDLTVISFTHLQDVQAAKIFADECANILERSINGVLNRNALLYFAYADFEEGRLKYEKVHSMYNKLLTLPDIDPTLVRGGRSASSLISYIYSLYHM